MHIIHFHSSLTQACCYTIFLLLLISSPITKTLAENSHVINFYSPNLYPESLRHHTISSISDAGIIETLISDTSLPENVTVEGITVDSRNNRILAVIHAVTSLLSSPPPLPLSVVSSRRHLNFIVSSHAVTVPYKERFIWILQLDLEDIEREEEREYA
ncbi:hypothetical protein RYX36_018648 [Vicia faba]